MTSQPQRGTSHRRASVTRDRGPLSLLLAALGGALGVVLAVWLLASTSALWALVIAVATAVAGALNLVGVINRQLSDSDGPDTVCDSSANPRV
jgi:hypothetical protein